MTSKLLPFLPPDARDRRYLEPFFGAGSLFFALQPHRAVLSDRNQHLIECYQHVRDKPELVASQLRRLRSMHSEEQYYRVRDTYNRSGPSAAQAARFIYLNATCFNGVFRVNLEGSFNVPFGDKPPELLFPSRVDLAGASEALKGTRLMACDYYTALNLAREGDVVYLDPPYPPLNGTSYFAHYTANRFSLQEQERVAEAFVLLDYLGCSVLMTNADLPAIRRLYRDYFITRLSVTRFVTCKKVRHRVGELVITNYLPRRANTQRHKATAGYHARRASRRDYGS